MLVRTQGSSPQCYVMGMRRRIDSAGHILFPPIHHTPVTTRHSLRAHERRVAQHAACVRMPGAGLWYGKRTADGSSYAAHALGVPLVRAVAA